MMDSAAAVRVVDVAAAAVTNASAAADASTSVGDASRAGGDASTAASTAIATASTADSTTATDSTIVTPKRKRIFVPPTRKRAKELAREDRARIKTLRDDARWSYVKISQETGYTMRQVQWACTHPPSPQKSKAGRRPLIRTPEKQMLKEWIEADAARGRVPWGDLRHVLPPPLNKYGEDALSTALRSLGFKYVGRSRRKVPAAGTGGNVAKRRKIQQVAEVAEVAEVVAEKVAEEEGEEGEESEESEEEGEEGDEEGQEGEEGGQEGGQEREGQEGQDGQQGQEEAREQPSSGDSD